MFTNLLYGIYEKELERVLRKNSTYIPRHLGVILDGNRRWAKSIGQAPAVGHKKGADKVDEFLEWSQKFGVEVVTLWMLSTDNLKRSHEELADLLEIIASTTQRLAQARRWKIRIVGTLDILPQDIANRLLEAQAQTSSCDHMQVNIAVGYGGRQEIVDAVKSYLNEQSALGKTIVEASHELSIENISQHLYTNGQPDPDLIIRTSGEQRLSGFMLWQSAQSEYYFCETYWPSFRYVDFLRALRDYAQRERRMGK